MRNLTINRISWFLENYPESQIHLDISASELKNLSNSELLDLFEEMVEYGVRELYE